MPSDAADAQATEGSDFDAIVAGAVVVLDEVTSISPYLPELAPDDRERVDAYVSRASSDATLRAYRSDWRLFCAWCEEKTATGRSPHPRRPSRRT